MLNDFFCKVKRKLKNIWKLYCRVNSRIILFESVGDLSDNSYALYQYLKNNSKKKYTYVWVVSDPEKYEDEKHLKFISYSYSAEKSNYYFAKAKYCFYTHRFCGIENKSSQKRVYLTHGFSYKNTKGCFWNPEINTDVISLSDYHRRLGDICSPGEINKSISLGYPRTDVLVNGLAEIPKALDFSGYSRLFVWLPTFRSHRNGDTAYSEGDLNEFDLISKNVLERINTQLAESNSFMIIKYHPSQDLGKVCTSGFSNIRVMSNEKMLEEKINLYELLSVSDALITDFSSVFADYLLADKPMAFELSDYEKYKNGKGFIIPDPIDVMPGKLVYNADDLSDFIADIVNGRDDFREKRNAECEKIHKYRDGRSAERISKYYKLI